MPAIFLLDYNNLRNSLQNLKAIVEGKLARIEEEK